MGDNETTAKPKRPSAPGMRILDDEIIDGFDLKDIKCRSCSGYGNCGYKQYFLDPDGKGAVSICMMARRKKQCERDGEEFDLSMLNNNG